MGRGVSGASAAVRWTGGEYSSSSDDGSSRTREPSLDLMSLTALDALLGFFLNSLIIFGPVSLDIGELVVPARVL